MAKINSTEVIASSKFNRFHLILLLWSFFIISFDGYDLVVYGTVVPTLIEKWNLTPVEAGAIGTYGLFGMMFGAILFGTLADRIGRKMLLPLPSFCLAYLHFFADSHKHQLFSLPFAF